MTFVKIININSNILEILAKRRSIIEEQKEPKEYPYYNGRQPVVITSYMDSRVTCTHCASDNIEQNHNSTVLLLVDGAVEAYLHAFCNDCWKESDFVVEILPKSTPKSEEAPDEK